MDATVAGSSCSKCGTAAPREEMFGIEPDLLCARCAERVRDAYRRGSAFRRRNHAPFVTSFVLAVSAFLFVLVHVLRKYPEWPTLWVESEAIWDGEVWRLVTSAFFHGGFLHFFFNAWFCWDLGRGIEDAWGHGTALALLLLGAGFSGAVSWMVSGPGIGLSGAVYAMAGFLFALRRTHPTAATLMGPRTVSVLLLWFVVGVVLTETGAMGIGNWAHGAGAVWGWLLGAAYAHRLRRPLVALVIALGVAAIALSPFLAFGDQAERRAEHLVRRAFLSR